VRSQAHSSFSYRRLASRFPSALASAGLLDATALAVVAAGGVVSGAGARGGAGAAARASVDLTEADEGEAAEPNSASDTAAAVATLSPSRRAVPALPSPSSPGSPSPPSLSPPPPSSPQLAPASAPSLAPEQLAKLARRGELAAELFAIAPFVRALGELAKRIVAGAGAGAGAGVVAGAGAAPLSPGAFGGARARAELLVAQCSLGECGARAVPAAMARAH